MLGIAGTVLAVYTAFFYDKHGQLTVRLDEPAQVLSVKQSVGGLDVSFGGENLKASKKTIWVLTAQIVNTGSAEVRRGDYDERAPLSFKISGGEIVEPPAIQSVNGYLQSFANPTATKKDVIFPAVIFDVGDSLKVSLLVLGDEAIGPSLSVSGRVAGMKRIEIEAADSVGRERRLWPTAVSGEWWVQIIRLCLYGVVFVLVAALSALATEGITDYFAKLRASKAAKTRAIVVSALPISRDAETQAAKAVYVELGVRGLRMGFRYISQIGAEAAGVVRKRGRPPRDYISNPDPVLVEILRQAAVLLGEPGSFRVTEPLAQAFANLAEALNISLELPVRVANKSAVGEGIDASTSITAPDSK